jgi:uncharacterized membrane protein YuzA (DUF378 family)
MITKNVGQTDKMIRIAVGVVLGLVSYIFLDGILAIVGYVASVTMFTTAFISFCGLYTLLGINTCKLDKRGEHNSEIK